MTLVNIERTEREILDDVQKRTGLVFQRIGGINTQEERIASVVLPVLGDWVDRLDNVRYLRALYMCFITPFARPFLDFVIARWQVEPDKVTSSILAQAVAAAFNCSDASTVWALIHQHGSCDYYYPILSKLAECSSVKQAARDELVEALDSKQLRAGDLLEIAKVPDPRIRVWFERQKGHPNAAVRALARRVTTRRALPKGLEYRDRAQSEASEVFSAECDVTEFRSTIKTITSRFQLNIARPVRLGSFLPSLHIKRWVMAGIQNAQGEVLNLWIRLEEIDAVTVVLEKRPTGNSLVT